MEKELFFHPNIKFLRKRAKLTQEDVAGTLGITRVKLNALEGGRTSSASFDDLFALSRLFKITVDALLTTDLSLLPEYRLRDLQSGNDVYLAGGKVRIAALDAVQYTIHPLEEAIEQ